MRKVLLDEGVPHPMRAWLEDTEVFTVQWMDWDGVKNGQLIQRVNRDAFEVVITNDKRWSHHQNPESWTFGVITLSTNS